MKLLIYLTAFLSFISCRSHTNDDTLNTNTNSSLNNKAVLNSLIIQSERRPEYVICFLYNFDKSQFVNEYPLYLNTDNNSFIYQLSKTIKTDSLVNTPMYAYVSINHIEYSYYLSPESLKNKIPVIKLTNDERDIITETRPSIYLTVTY